MTDLLKASSEAYQSLCEDMRNQVDENSFRAGFMYGVEFHSEFLLETIGDAADSLKEVIGRAK